MIMANNELTQTYTIPLKSCQNSVIEHSLVSICLRIEWPEKGGDDPSLVIDVTNKQLLNSYGQPNQPSLLVNSVHRQHQDNLPSKYQQQYYHSSGINNYDSTNLPISNSINDHNDISSMTTTTTVVYNAHQPQYQPSTSPTAIQKIKSDLQSQLPSFNQSYLSSQHVIQAPLNNLNDSRLDINMSTMNPTSSIKQVPSMINPYYDLQQSSISNNSQLRSLVCTCPNPTIYHAHNCPVHFSNHQDFSSESLHRTNIQHISSLPSMKEPMITKTSMPFPNANLMKTIDLSSNVTTIISQPSTFLNNPSMCPTIKIPSMNINNNFSQQHRHHPHHHHQPLNVSQVIINNPSNYPINSSLPMPIIGQQNIGSKKPRARKKPIKRNSVNNQEQNSNQSQEINFINNQNSPTKQQNINTPSLLSSQPRMVILQDSSQITANTSSGSNNDLDVKSTEPLSPLTNSNVRSPVELNVHIPLSKTTTNQAKPTEVVDQVISEVLEGKGIIRTQNSSKSFISQQQKSPLSSKLVWESNGATTTTKTFVAPLDPKPQPQQSLIFDSNISTSNHQNIFPITQQTIHSNSIEQNQITNTLSTTTNAKKRIKSTNNSKPKRITKPNTNINQTSSPITSTSNEIQSNQYSIMNSLELPDIDQNNDMFHYTDSNPPDQPRILYPNDHPYDIKIDDIFQLKPHQSFDSSTIPSPLSTTDQLLNSISMDNSLMTSVPTNLDVYDFFTSNPVSSSSTLEDNQVTSTVITPPDGQNNYQSEQQSYSQIDTNLQSQTQTLQLSEITTDQMNLNDVTSKQQPTKSSNNKINQSLKRSTKHLKQRKSSSSSKPICTRCGFKQLIDITQHEFPKQKGLVFECLSCGNNSIRSNVSAEERKIRLAKIAADHLNKINCQFCHRDFHSHNDYITHLRDDHDSNKPM